MTAHFVVSGCLLHHTFPSHFNNGLRVQTGHDDYGRKLVKYSICTSETTAPWPDCCTLRVCTQKREGRHHPIFMCVCRGGCQWAFCSDETGWPVGQPSFAKYLLSWTLATYVSPQIIESITTTLSPPCFSHKTSRTERSSEAELQLGPSTEHLAQ